jgi:hypothetical protein
LALTVLSAPAPKLNAQAAVLAAMMVGSRPPKARSNPRQDDFFFFSILAEITILAIFSLGEA